MARLRLIVGLVGLVASVACLQAGAASAATVFCKENVETCPKEAIYPLGTSYTAGSNGKFTSIETLFPVRNIDCATATMKWKTTETTGTGALKGQVESASFGECAEKEETCTPTVAAGSLPWKTEFERKSGVNYFTVASTLQVTCGFGGTCTYSPGTLHGRLTAEKGAESTRVEVENRLGRSGGPITCPQEIIWQADLLLESPTSAFLTLG